MKKRSDMFFLQLLTDIPRLLPLQDNYCMYPLLEPGQHASPGKMTAKPFLLFLCDYNCIHSPLSMHTYHQVSQTITSCGETGELLSTACVMENLNKLIGNDGSQ